MSWFQLLDILKQGRAEAEYYASIPPMACPLCGEPLTPGPPRSSEATLFCRVEGWSYPRDFVRQDLS